MKARFRVKSNKPVTGQALAAAVKRIAESGHCRYHQELSFVSDEEKLYQIGQNSEYSAEDLVIGVGSNATPEISMEAEYTEVYVLSWKHSGIKLAVLDDNEEVVEAMRSFRDKLQAAL